MKRIGIILALLLTLTSALLAQAENERYRVWLTDKNESSYSTDRPEEFLSPASIARREQQGIAIDTYDLPVNTHYIEQIKLKGCDIVLTSRWMNTVVVECSDATIIQEIEKLPFVSHTECVWYSQESEMANTKPRYMNETASCRRAPAQTSDELSYGKAWRQVEMLNIDSLHQAGYRGQGMTIAVIDGSFDGVDAITAIDKSQILGRYNVLNDTFDNIGDDHGTSALSCMAANAAGEYIGTAPEANYYLIITEAIHSEHAFEEDAWVRGAELADSLGVQVISSSLGYNEFDEPWAIYTREDLDGKTAFSTRAANIAADRGLLVVLAGGNYYNYIWKMITFPADAPKVLAVGSVNDQGTHSSFSSMGFVEGDYVKPNVVAMGSSTAVYNSDGAIVNKSGTSFATPLIAGAMTCLWQALPHLSVAEIIDCAEEASSMHDAPDELLGYGIPNFYKAYKKASSVESPRKECGIYVSHRTLHLPATEAGTTVTLYNTAGSVVWQSTPAQGTSSIGLQGIEQGIYIITVNTPHSHYTAKIIL